MKFAFPRKRWYVFFERSGVARIEEVRVAISTRILSDGKRAAFKPSQETPRYVTVCDGVSLDLVVFTRNLRSVRRVRAN